MSRQYQKQEDNVKKAIAHYINLQYPHVPFKMEWDHLKLPIGVAVKLKSLRWANPDFVWPDCFISCPMNAYSGLYLEVKKNREEIYKKDGQLRQDEQTQKEARSLLKLRELGYAAVFTWSIDHAMEKIDRYFKCIE